MHHFKKMLLHLFFYAIIGQCFFVYAEFFQDLNNIPRKIKVVMDDNYPPYVFRDEEGNLQGITIDQWKLWERKTGIQVDIHGMDWAEAQNKMRKGEFDVIDTIFFTEERAKIYDYSKPYAKIDVSIFFHKDIPGIFNVHSLKGFTVAVKSGDAAIDYLRRNGINNLQEFPSYEAIVKAAKERKVHVAVIDNPPALYFLYKAGILEEFRHSDPLYTGEFHRAVRKGNALLLKLVQDGFSQISEKEFKQIDKKWFGAGQFFFVPYLRYIAIGFGILILTILLMSLWNAILRKKVREKTLENIKEIKKREEERQQEFLRNALLLKLYQMSESPIEQIMDLIVQHCVSTTGSKYGFIGYISDDERLMQAQIWSDEVLRQCAVDGKPVIFPIENAGLWAIPVKEKRPIVVNNYNDPNPYKKGYPEGHISIERFLCIPVAEKDCVRILLGLANKQEPYTEADVFHLSLILEGLWGFIKKKKIEDALKSSEERYRTVIESSNDAITIVSNGKHVYVNKRFYEITGYSEQEIIGKPIIDWIHPEDRERVMKIAITRENQEEVPSRYEFRGLRKDGTIIYIDVSATYINYLNKTMSLAFLRDITERKQAEAVLNQEREKFSTLIENIPFGMAMVDKKGHYLYLNTRWKELFGYDPQEIPDGKTWFRKVFPDPSYRKQAISAWVDDTKDASPGLKKTRTFTLTCKDGTQKIINFTFISIQNDLYIIICEDVTELKRIEEQLMQSQKMEAVGRLAGGIAHDFNNMLTIILGHTQLAQLTLDENSPLYHRFLEIQKAAQRSAALTKNLLAFARKQTIAPRTLNINHQIEDILKMLHRLIGENIELVWMPQPNLWDIKIDPSQLNQIVINIVINAKDAIEDLGTITLETQNVTIDENYCKTHLGFTPGEYVMIAISDNGTGMDKDVLEHIFEPFFTTKGIEKGSGLGLSTVYGIVKQNNGFINVYSEPKKGSTFKIYLPRYVGHKEEPTGFKWDTVIKSKGETVLVVEDEKDVLDLCTSMLEQLGYKVIVAPSPHEAIKKAQTYEEEIHLLITDVIMPEMNGKELADRIRSIKPAIKCLFMSGYTANAIVKNGILKKGVNYIQKPFSLQELSVKVREVIEI